MFKNSVILLVDQSQQAHIGHRTLNTCKGVIRCRELVDCDKPEILTQLRTQGVTDITNITVIDDSGGRRNANTFIVALRLPAIPKHLKIGYTRVPVSTYIPNPLRCFNCETFGHWENTCKGRLTCATCGQAGHNTDDCTNEIKCPNLSLIHI